MSDENSATSCKKSKDTKRFTLSDGDGWSAKTRKARRVVLLSPDHNFCNLTLVDSIKSAASLQWALDVNRCEEVTACL